MAVACLVFVAGVAMLPQPFLLVGCCMRGVGVAEVFIRSEADAWLLLFW